MMDNSEITQNLKLQLNSFVKNEIVYVDNVTSPLLFILDFSPDDDKPLASFAFSLLNFANNNFESKCWCNFPKMRAIGVNCNLPSSHPKYKEITHNEITYYPFSVNLSDYNPQSVESILDLVKNLYHHIEFD